MNPTLDELCFSMRYTGMLRKDQPLPRYDYRPDWMKQGLVIGLAKPYTS